MGLFAKTKKSIKEYRSGMGGNWSLPGNHRVRILRCIDKQDGYKGHSCIVEYEVISSDNPDMKEGDKRSWVNNITKHGDMALGNIADFIRAGFQRFALDRGEHFEVDAIDFTDEDSERVFGEENILAGVEMDLYVYMRKTNAGGDFSMHVWGTRSQEQQAESESAA